MVKILVDKGANLLM